MEAWAVPLTAVIISMATVVLTQVNRRSDVRQREEELRDKADADYVSRLERRLDRAEKGLEECLDDREELRKRIVALERKTN